MEVIRTFLGDRVKHKLSNEELTIVKINNTVATCHTDEPHYFIGHKPIHDRVCLIENLIKI